MNNQSISWTKVYKVDHQAGSFKLFVSSHTNGDYRGSVLHHTRTGSWSTSSSVLLKMKLENFIDVTESAVYLKCEQWIQQHLPGKYRVTLDYTNGN